MKLSDNKVGLLMSVGVGGLVYLLYLVGKSSGKVEAYNDCGNMLQTAIETLGSEVSEGKGEA